MSGTTATCTGDLSEGVSASGPGIEELNINALSGDIAPADGVSGISFVHQETYPDDIVITVTGDGNRIVTNGSSGIYARNGYDRRDYSGAIEITSEIDIVTQGDGAIGIEAHGDDKISIRSTGNITTSGEDVHGISALHHPVSYTNSHDIEVTSVGDIATTGTGSIGILADGYAYGEISVHSTGDINAGAAGIEASGSYSEIDITSVGDITTRDSGSTGILAANLDGDVRISSTGNIHSQGRGIYVGNYYADTVIESVGNIHAVEDDAIYIRMRDGSASINSTGDLRSDGGSAIDINLTYRSDSEIEITSTGNIEAQASAILVRYSEYASSARVNITSEGNITSHAGSGISSSLYRGRVAITTNGNINAADSGISAWSGYGSAYVHFSGEIIAGGAGISAGSASTEVLSFGNITSTGHGIRASGRNRLEILATGDISAAEGNAIQASAIGYGLDTPISIVTSGDIAGANGIFASVEYMGGVAISNSGDVTGRDGHGISIHVPDGGEISLSNSGSIQGAMTGIFIGERAANSGATITNSGHIQGDGGFAIDLRGDGNDVVTLEFGTTIEGALDFGNGNDGLGGSNAGDIDTLNIADGLNLVLEFADASGLDSDFASMPEIINVSDSSETALVGNRLVVYEMGSFAAFTTYLSSFSGNVLNTLDAQQSTHHFDPPSVGLVTRSTRDQHPGVLRSWGTAFGSRSLQGSGDQVGDFQSNYFGFSAGFESGHTNGEGVFGFFAGAGRSDIDLALGGGSIDINSAFAGIYWQRDLGVFNLRASLMGGVTQNETTRIVSGSTAEGEFDGRFIVPSLTLSYPFEAGGSQMLFSNRLSYLHMHLDSYNEVGASPAFVHDRDVNLVNLRSQLEFSSPFANQGSQAAQLNLRLGVDATIDVGSDPVVATLFGTAVPFELQSDDDIYGFLGFDYQHQFADGRWDLNLTGEVRSDFNDSVAGSIGLSLVHRF